jgi:hypothetical protein
MIFSNKPVFENKIGTWEVFEITVSTDSTYGKYNNKYILMSNVSASKFFTVLTAGAALE